MIIVLDFGGQYNQLIRAVSVSVMCMRKYTRTRCRWTRSGR